MRKDLINEIFDLKQQIRDLDYKLESRERDRDLKRLKFWADAIYISYFVVWAVVVIIYLKK